MPLSEQSLKTYLADELQVDVSGVDATTLLFSSGLVDSFALITLITYIEEQSGLKMGAEDTTLDNLDSIERILAYAVRAA